MNWHEAVDERSYEMHQVVADVLRRDPGKLQLVLGWIDARMADPEYSEHSKDSLQEWLDVIHTEGPDGVLRVLSDRSEEPTRLRQNSPFAIIMPQDDRMRILRRYEAFRARAHPAGV